MLRLMIGLGASVAAVWLWGAAPRKAAAQYPVAVSSYYAAPTVTFAPVRRGFFGRRVVLQPVLTHAPVVAPQATYYAPMAPAYAPATPAAVYYAPRGATTYFGYGPSPLPTTTYWRP